MGVRGKKKIDHIYTYLLLITTMVLTPTLTVPSCRQPEIDVPTFVTTVGYPQPREKSGPLCVASATIVRAHFVFTRPHTVGFAAGLGYNMITHRRVGSARADVVVLTAAVPLFLVVAEIVYPTALEQEQRASPQQK